MIRFTTNMGVFDVELNEAAAPKTCENLLSYVRSGFYNGTIFHRVISGFMIQGGGFEPGLKQKQTKAPIENEANNGLKNDKYTIAMARTNEPVLHQCGRQRLPESHLPHLPRLGLRRVRQGCLRHRRD